MRRSPESKNGDQNIHGGPQFKMVAVLRSLRLYNHAIWVYLVRRRCPEFKYGHQNVEDGGSKSIMAAYN